MRLHHLIEEAKAEVDITYAEVKQVESRLIEIEMEYAPRIAAADQSGDAVALEALRTERERMREDANAEAIYELHNMAVERYAKVCGAFGIVGLCDDVDESSTRLKALLFAEDELRAHGAEIGPALADFQTGLRDYMRRETSSENDRKVRDNWNTIETLLRRLGRGL